MASTGARLHHEYRFILSMAHEDYGFIMNMASFIEWFH
jgi:hypothetical protein